MDQRTYETTVGYIQDWMTASGDLAAATGLARRTLASLAEAGVLPRPTYSIGRAGVRSGISQLGEIAPDEATRDYYGPAVIGWLQRASLFAVDDTTLSKLQEWLAHDLEKELRARRASASQFGWTHLMHDGEVDTAKVVNEAATLIPDWMNGGWAVCLRRFDGHHLVTKEIERQRIAALTARDHLSPPCKLALFDAMARLDAVLLPFAPHERAAGTPGRCIDEPAAAWRMPWAVPSTTT